MGDVYVAFPTFSQIHWKNSEADVKDYLSRAWVMQEFLVSETYLLPDLKALILQKVAEAEKAGAKIVKGMRALMEVVIEMETDKIGDELEDVLSRISSGLSDYKSVLGLETMVAQYWMNDQHFFWLSCMDTMLGKLKEAISSIKEGNENGEEAITPTLRAAMQCMCPPKLALVDTRVIERAMGMQTPNSNVLGRLEYCFLTSSLSVESDREYAVFGVFNALSETKVTAPSYGGIWPSLRGTQVATHSGSSGLGVGVQCLITSVTSSLDVATCILYEKSDPLRRRILFLALRPDTPRAFALWTYSNLTGDNTDDLGSDLKQAIVFAEEIDVQFKQEKGTIRQFINKLVDTSTRPSTRRMQCAPQSLYCEGVQVGDKPKIIE
eukprot:m.44148 g.44148  ORF g.44148 m.44148 type:complete len:380 (+) comp10051_c0_seq1:548-1687(+)